MKNIEKLQEHRVSILGLNIKGLPPENTEKVRQTIMVLLQHTNLQIFQKDKSPQEILRTLGFSIPEIQDTKNLSEKGTGTELANYFRKNSMSAEAGKIMDEARKDFREGFAFKHDINEKE
ncbi:MAG: hypothetical protein KAH77_08645 [Thiomargarita sp.]|nr:hypothetical protein [Thiomargarita sp.]